MKKKSTNEKLPLVLPTSSELEAELRRDRHNKRRVSVVWVSVFSLVVVAAIAVLIATLWLPVLQIYGTSMTPTLEDGEILFSTKTADFQQGDIVAFYYNNKILVKRVIATSGEWVNIAEDGTVYVNDEAIEEPYLEEKALGDCNIPLPYQVPDGKLFVMGDHRSTSIDSRHSSIGAISPDQIVGKIVFRIWPLNRIGGV